ncbi:MULTISPECIES: hypothetical protein [unclassified Streptomyces]|uniref:hypothetical protein n=1 Tax=unclassified Streptomyces TaxID=2593676 RepID=UPI002E122CE6|nr:hypothetical protein OG457_29115 [Streptomyces sp. NBC_01207]WTA20678.1 hypothetical protein OG365_23030 [Streptomyces sp. NBC_00853]
MTDGGLRALPARFLVVRGLLILLLAPRDPGRGERSTPGPHAGPEGAEVVRAGPAGRVSGRESR